MIKRLSLKNFKCFTNLAASFSNLTLLCGLNGTGKSSLIQSLLLMRQSFLEQRLKVNGDLVKLGNPVDIFAANAADNNLNFIINFEGNQTFSITADYDVTQKRFINEILGPSRISRINKPLLSKNAFFYVCADRFGPRVSFPLSEEDNLLSNLGKHGEYVIHYLNRYGERTINNQDLELLPQANETRLLSYQVQAWLREIVPGVRFDTKAIESADIATMQYAFEGGDDVTPWFRPTNVAFGISFTLPIILALLAAPKDGLIILENPEAHLHPRGQTMMGDLISKVAKTGTQVIVETHSEHLLRRVQLKMAEEFLSEKQVNVYFSKFFAGEATLEPLEIDEFGRIKNWPESFFGDSLGEIEKQTRLMLNRMKNKR